VLLTTNASTYKINGLHATVKSFLPYIYLTGIVAIVSDLYGCQLTCSCTAAIVNNQSTVTGPRAIYTLADLAQLRKESIEAKDRRESWAKELVEKKEDIKKNGHKCPLPGCKKKFTDLAGLEYVCLYKVYAAANIIDITSLSPKTTSPRKTRNGSGRIFPKRR
jgi:hypothetical protein